MNTPMKALSIRQPWAWAIIHAGKNIENRTWPTKQTGPVLVHAGKKFDMDGYWWLIENREILPVDIPHRDDFQIGGIVGVATIVDCVDRHESPWFFGPWGFVLTDVSPLPFNAMPGKLGFFNVDSWMIKSTEE